MLSYNGISEVDSLNMCVEHKRIHWARHLVPGQLSSLYNSCPVYLQTITSDLKVCWDILVR